MERFVTDLRCSGNGVSLSRSSANLRYARAGREWQRKALSKNELLHAPSPLQSFSGALALVLAIASRVRPDGHADPKSCPATFLEQVLRLVEDCNGERLQSPQPASCGGLSDPASCHSLVVESLIVWRSIWKLWHQLIYRSLSIPVKEVCAHNLRVYQESFRAGEACMRTSFCKPVSQHQEHPRWNAQPPKT